MFLVRGIPRTLECEEPQRLISKPGAVNPKQKEYLEDILNSGRHLLQLISDILDLAKVGAGKMEFYPERFSLQKAIQEACAISEPIAQKRGIRIKVAVALCVRGFPASAGTQDWRPKRMPSARVSNCNADNTFVQACSASVHQGDHAAPRFLNLRFSCFRNS